MEMHSIYCYIEKVKYVLFMLPGLLILFLFFVYPLSEVALLSLQTKNPEGYNLSILSFSNYIYFFDRTVYWDILLKTLKIAALVSIFTLILGYLVAYFISMLKIRISFFLFIILLSLWVNELIRSYAWIVILQSVGLINQTFFVLGLISYPIRFLGTELGIIIGMVNLLLPFMTLFIFNSLSKIDKNIIFAARNLGANNIQIFLKIIIPLTLSGVVSGSLCVFLIALGLYITPMLLGGPKNIVMSALISQQVIGVINWPFAASSSLILVVLVFAIVILFWRFLRFDQLFDKL